MGLNLDKLIETLGPEWLVFNAHNILIYRDSLKLYNTQRYDLLVKNIQSEPLHLFDGLFFEIYPFLLFVYNKSENKFKIVSVGKHPTLPFFFPDKYDSETDPVIYDSKESFLNNYKQGDAFLILRDDNTIFENKTFHSDYLILGTKIYIHVEYDHYRAPSFGYKGDGQFQILSLISGVVFLFLSKYSSNFDAFGITLSFFCIVAFSAIISFVSEDLLYENKRTRNKNMALLLVPIFSTIFFSIIKDYAPFLTLAIVLSLWTQYKFRKQNYNLAYKSAEERHKFIIDHLQNDI